ncbi:MAG: DUF58 domain-containing protein [Limisphaera sp.]
MSALLSPELQRMLDRLRWSSRQWARSAAHGEQRSRARGTSVEFADYRAYVPGDDFRHIDWNLYARLDRLFLRLFEEERELPVHVWLDASASMRFGEPQKFRVACQLAGAVGYVALGSGACLTVHVFPAAWERVHDGGPESAPPAESESEPARPGGKVSEAEAARQWACELGLRRLRGRGVAVRLWEGLEGLRPGGRVDLAAWFRMRAAQVRAPGVAVVISDFLDAQAPTAGLAALVARGLEVHAVQVLAPQEWAPETFGELRLLDAETGAWREVTFGRYRWKAYRRTVERYVEQLRTFCRGHGVGFVSVRSDADLSALLGRELRSLGLWS